MLLITGDPDVGKPWTKHQRNQWETTVFPGHPNASRSYGAFHNLHIIAHGAAGKTQHKTNRLPRQPPYHNEAAIKQPPLTRWPPGLYDCNLKSITFKLNIQKGCLGTHSEIGLTWMPLNLTNEKSTLVQVMACRLRAPNSGNVDPYLCRHIASLRHNQLNKQHFQISFCVWKLLHFDWNFIKICSQWSN